MKTFGKILCLGVLCLGLVGLTGCKRTPEEKAEWMVKKTSKKLDLNEDQKAKLVELKDAILVHMKSWKGERQAKFEKVKSMVSADRLNRADFESMIEKKKSKFDDAFATIYPKLENFHASLSPEQKQKAVKIMEKFKKRCGDSCHFKD